MKITVLGSGTSQGIPVVGCSCAACMSSDPRDRRLRSSILIESQGVSVLVDSGPDIRQQALIHNIEKIDAVLYTHEHYDHTAGLDDLRPYNFMQGGVLPIYGLRRVLENIEARFSYAFDGGVYPGAPRMQSHFITGGTEFSIGDMTIMPICVMHGSLPILGYRFDDFVYLTDVSYVEDRHMYLLDNAEVIILAALQKEKHYSHLSLGEAVDLLEEVQPEKGYLTHVSHTMGPIRSWEDSIPDFIHSAYDGLQIAIQKETYA